MDDGMGPSGPIFSLDEAAALLIQLDATDRTEMDRLRVILEDIAFEGGLRPAAQASVAGAARRMADALAADAAAARALIDEAGGLIERAMNAQDVVPLPGGTPAPAAPAAAGAAPQPGEPVEPAGAPGSETTAAAPAIEVDTALLPDFIMECREYLQGAEAALLALELDPGDAESVNTIFRAFHTIKGTSAFLGLQPITELAHHAESLFNRFRDGEIRCTGPRADISLRAVDVLVALLDATEQLLSGGELRLPDGYDDVLHILRDPAAAGLLEEGDGAPMRLGDLLVTSGKARRADVESTLASAAGRPLGLALVEAKAASLTDVAHALRKQRVAAPAETQAASDASVRVSTHRLDLLVDMVGELVVAHSMVAQDRTLVGDSSSELARNVAHAGKIVRELQDLSVSMRMVPLRATFQKMSRLVRDIARRSGKQVEFVCDGEDTEIDRNLVDIIGDPLVHMIRNAVDHGLETPDRRAEAGKGPTGTVRLAAFHAGGNVVIELSDDGRGLDRERILAKAVAKGIVDADRTLPDAEVWRLIFAPGFSTAEQVTDLSGRGVGMDVVKSNIETVRGRVEISSEAGRGTTFIIRLPLTLAVTDGMLVRVAGERYIVPTVNIQMSFRPSREMISTVGGRGEMVLLRGELLPIVRLHRLLGVAGAVTDPVEALLVIVGSGEQRCAVLVDELLGQQQIVAKSLGEGLGKVAGIAGGAVLGDGRIGLILDVAEIMTLFERVAA